MTKRGADDADVITTEYGGDVDYWRSMVAKELEEMGGSASSPQLSISQVTVKLANLTYSSLHILYRLAEPQILS